MQKLYLFHNIYPNLSNSPLPALIVPTVDEKMSFNPYLTITGICLISSILDVESLINVGHRIYLLIKHYLYNIISWII